MSLASSTLADAGGPGTREDEDGVYGAVAVCRYALHRMPNKHKLKLVDPSGSGGGGVGGAPADGPTTDEDLDGVTGNGNGDTATADRFADAVFESKAIEGISRCSRIDVVSKARARLPRTLNGRERPNDQVVLHGEGRHPLAA